MKTSWEIYRAYLNRQRLVVGGSARPRWVPDESGSWSVTTAPTGGSRELPSDPAYIGQKMREALCEDASMTPRMWKRGYSGGYLVDKVDVPEVLSPSGEWFASVQADNIVLRSTRDGGERNLTSCGTSDRFWDLEAQVLARLQGRFGQLAVRTVNPWSPDSLTLLAYRRDVTDVFRIPRMHWLAPFERVEWHPFQKAGAKLDSVEPVLIDIRSGKQIPVALQEIEDRYIQWLGWRADGSEAMLIVYTRDLKQADIFAVAARSGAIRTLLTERGATAVKNQQDEVWSNGHGFHLLPDQSGFLWLSTRDGWNHIYHYEMSGALIAQLTRGDWPVYEVSNIGSDKFIYFTAAIDAARPYDLHVCRVHLKGGEVDRLSTEKGIHSPSFSPDGRWFLDTHSTVDRPPRTDLLHSDGTPVRTISEMDISPLQEVGYRPAEEFTVKAADGATDLLGVLYKPSAFDPSRRYPVIEYIYGGPQVIVAERFFSVGAISWLNLPWALAQLGYVVVCLDARGTPGRSKAFQDAIHGNLTAGIADHAGAIRQLCERYAWMDAQRVGIYGGSWGGAYATHTLIEYPDVYHVGLALEPSYDPWHSIMYEPYLGLPQHNRAAYEGADVIKHAARLKRPLMIVTGTRYNACVPTVFRMVRALVDAGIDHELVVVPEASHGFIGVEDKYFLMKLTGWFERHLGLRAIT